MTRHRKSNGTDLARVTCRGGTRKSLGPWGSDEARDRYLRGVARWIQSGANGPPHAAHFDEDAPLPAPEPAAEAQPHSGPTIGEAFEGFIDHWISTRVAADRKRSTDLALVAAGVRRLIRSLEGGESRPLASIGVPELATWRDSLVTGTGQGGRGLKRVTIRKYMTVVTGPDGLLEWAMLRGDFDRTALRDIRELVQPPRKNQTAAAEHDERLPASTETLAAIMPLLPKTIRDIVNVQLITAARPDEVLGLTRASIDTDADEHGNWRATVTYRKDPSDRTDSGRRSFLVFPAATEILAPYLAKRRDGERLFWTRDAVHQALGRPLTPREVDRYGTSCEPGWYRSRLLKACEKAIPMPEGLEGKARADWRAANWVTPYQLRHLAGTVMRERFDLEWTQVQMGHKRRETTERYARPNGECAEAEASGFNLGDFGISAAG